MQCSNCGNTLAPDARFCPRCGDHVIAQPQPGPVYAGMPAILPYSRVSRHLQIAGVLWLVYAVTRTIEKLVGLMVLHGIFGGQFHTNWDHDWISWGSMGFAALWPIVAVSIVGGLILSLLTGYALLTRQPWGRVFAIVVSVLALIHPVLGTALGIYTLWVLASDASGAEYAAIADATARG